MANDGNINPMFVDSAAAVTTKQVTIQGILWTDYDTAGNDIADTDDFTLTDVNGNILCHKQASSAGDDLYISFPFGLKADGVTCSAIDGGAAYIYLV